MQKKVCRDCREERLIDELCPDKNCSFGVKALCRPCAAKRMAKQRKKPHSKHKENKRRANQKLRSIVISAYGGRCVICNEHRREFLALDHINNDGSAHRKLLTGRSRSTGVDGYAVYREAIRKQYPKDILQVLCYNCNTAKQTHGYNPVLLEKQLLEQSEGYMGEGI